MKKMILLASLLMFGLVVSETQASFASENDNTNEPADAQALLASKVTIAQAIQTAETKAGGKASSATFEVGSGAGYYHIEVVAADGTQQDLAIDASSGEVMKLAMQGDRDQDGDQHEGKSGGQDEGERD